MPKLNIPVRYKAALAKIHSLSDAAFIELQAALEKFRPSSVNKEGISRIAESTPSIPAEEVEGIVESLMGLQMARSMAEVSLDQFCSNVGAEIEKGGSERLTLSSPEREAFVKRIKTLLSFDSLATAAKSRDLQTDHGWVYLNARIVTDMRPVFRGAPDEPPTGMVLFHTLRVSYLDRTRDGERANLYIALDENDLGNLKRLLERAELKAKTLRTQLQTAGIEILGDTRSN